MSLYDLRGTETIATPQLVYYREILIANIEKAIRIAGGPERLWPHVKSHKVAEVVRLQQAQGIQRFKCATIAEAEMTARCEAGDILLAYPLIGPAVDRFLKLAAAYPRSRFWAIGDDFDQIAKLAAASAASGAQTRLLLDLDLGQHRTGVPLDRAVDLYARCAALDGLQVLGFHCYDGHLHQDDPAERRAAVDDIVRRLESLKAELAARNLESPVWVMGGSPTFPFHAGYPGTYLSPGTVVLWDHSYSTHYPDLDFVPAAVLLTRVVSHPGPGLFTLDLGYKGIAADPEEVRGVIVGLDAEPRVHNEEHWVFAARDGNVPDIGAVLYVIPAHVCPTSALYPFVLVAEQGAIVNVWDVAARNRKIFV